MSHLLWNEAAPHIPAIAVPTNGAVTAPMTATDARRTDDE